MTVTSRARRTLAEIDFGSGQLACARIGRRTIHQFWYLFSTQFRGVLLAPQRRPDTGHIAWTWMEPAESSPPTAQELVEVRRRLATASQLLAGGVSEPGPYDEAAEGSEARSLDQQVRRNVGQMVTQLVAQSDRALAGFVCRTETGLMLHSWGADRPALPSCPDAPKPGVSGTVWVDDRPASGLTVELENAAGTGALRTRSGANGGFSFKTISPGTYRLRVSGRADFSPTGLEITVAQEAVTDLALRNDAAPSAGAAPGPVLLPAQRLSGWPHWRPAGLALLAVGTLGFAIWTMVVRSTTARPDPESLPTGWQSARGDLQVRSEALDSAEARPAGRDSAWTKLTAGPTPASASARPHRPPGPGNSGSRPEPSSDDFSPAGGDRTRAPVDPAGEKFAAADSDPTSPARPVDSGSREASAANTAAAAATSENRATPGADLGEPKQNDPSSGPVLASATARRSQSGGGGTTVDQVSREKEGSASEALPENISAASAGGSGPASRPSNPTAGAFGSGSAGTASGTGAAASGNNAVASGPEAAAESTNHLAASLGGSRPDRTGATNSPSGAARSADLSRSEDAAESRPEATAPPASPRANLAIVPTPTQAEVASDRSSAPAAKKTDQTDPDDAATGPDASPVKKTLTRETAGGEAGSPAAKSGDLRTENPNLAGELTWRGTFRPAAWVPRLVRDVLLPTRPVPAGEADAIESLRQKTRREQAARMPDLFRSPVTKAGLTLEFPADETGRLDPPRWRDANGAEPAGASAQDNRAELAWFGAAPPRGMNYSLGWPDGKILARVSTDQQGALVLLAVRDVRGWCWTGIEGPVEKSPGPKSSAQLEWRLLPDAALPPAWLVDDQWADGRGRRVAVPFNAGPAQRQRYVLALVDRATGWALSSEIIVP